jgi:Protein of unknown function (DUF2628)
MSVYTVHEPPLRAADAAPNPERFVFVRDGFYFWAFVLTPLWLLWRRLWLIFLLYALIAGGTETAMHYTGIGSGWVILVQLLISLLIGVEASTLQRFSLRRRGWKNVGVVSGDKLEDAEQRFFDSWVRAASGKRPERPVAAPPTVSPPPWPVPAPDIIGLFPDPGASR